MEHSTQPPDYSKETPKPLPSIGATRKAVIDAVIRRAIASYHAALRERDEAEVSFGEDPQLDPMMCVVFDRARDAEMTLVRAILANGRKAYGYKAEKKLWPSRGVRCDGRLYLVTPAGDVPPDLEVGEVRPDGADAMTLRVTDLADVDDVGTCERDPVWHPDGSRIWHIDDPRADEPDELPTATPDVDDQAEDLAPSPRRGHPFDQADDVPRPLLRQSTTLVPPWDNGSDATLEVIVLAEPADDADVTATRRDVPELAEAGWGSTSMKGLQVFMRVVG